MTDLPAIRRGNASLALQEEKRRAAPSRSRRASHELRGVNCTIYDGAYVRRNVAAIKLTTVASATRIYRANIARRAHAVSGISRVREKLAEVPSSRSPPPPTARKIGPARAVVTIPAARHRQGHLKHSPTGHARVRRRRRRRRTLAYTHTHGVPDQSSAGVSSLSLFPRRRPPRE